MRRSMKEEDDDEQQEPVVTLEGNLIEHREELQQIDPTCPAPLNTERKKFWNTRRILQQVDQGKLAEEWARRLEHHSLLLVERLFEYLSLITPGTNHSQGISLPASAIGWLATQIYPTHHDAGTHARQKEPQWMGASMRDRISLLKYLLPRATHLRVTAEKWPPSIKRGKNREGIDTPASFEGNDISLSEISVHSALTMETSLAAPPSLQAFLIYYHGIQTRPRVDIRVFPSLSVLFLDRVAPEWIANLPADLQLLRVDRSGIFNLTMFLFQPLPEKPESEDAISCSQLKSMTHLKLSHCAIGELSGLRGTKRLVEREGDPLSREYTYIPPPLSRLPNLLSLCMSNNELRTVRSAFAGLSSLTMLRSVDLSFNFLSTLKGCNGMVGNIKELILTGNRLRTVKGLDKCYSLETLYLDSNEFQEIADVATLANLPQLSMLYLHDNPLVEKDPKGYRVRIFDLFKESRLGSLLPNATYRQLLNILPILDGEPASKRELVGLRGLTFTQSVVPAGISLHLQVEQMDQNNLPTINDLRDVDFSGEATSSTSLLISRPRRVQRNGKRRQARVDDGFANDQFLMKKSTYSAESLALPALQFSVQDVITSLSTPVHTEDESVDLTTSEPSVDGGLVNAFKVILAEKSMDEYVDDTRNEAKNHHENYANDNRSIQNPASPSMKLPLADHMNGISHTRDLSDMSLSTINGDDESVGDLGAGKGDECSKKIMLDGPPLVTLEEEEEGNDTLEEMITSVTRSSVKPMRSMALTLNDAQLDFEEYTDTIPISKVSFPEHVWGSNSDAHSIASSLGTNTHDFLAEDKYHMAEENTFYDGPDLYKHLSVVTNLELYFKSFVFVPEDHASNRPFAGQLSEEELSTRLLETAPRIQLRPLDRKTMESLNREQSVGIKPTALNETFLRVWREDVLACGKAAARRVTPCRTPRRSFHGDCLFSNGKLEKSCETRTLIMCSTHAAIYLIPDYDQLTIQSQSKHDKRRFPSPIPREALFQNAPWPHALARHPIHTLNRITIGFGFQRLTLRFGPGSAIEQTVMGNDYYTYVLNTCNKLRTVSLLQQLQEQAKEAASKVSTLVVTNMTIDNDDKQVLDALSAAVAPSSVGIILHYQILQQRWKHGDRGVVRRVCVVTDQQLFLLDEDYVGDGSESFEAGARTFGDILFRIVDSAELVQVSQVQAAGFDPKAITVVIRPKSRLQRTRNWRLLCRDAEGAERLVEDVRKAVNLS